MDSWETFSEISIPDKEAFYSELNKEGIFDEDYAHAQKFSKAFEIKSLGEYHDLYAQCDTLSLADVFGNFRDKCIKIYKLHPVHFLSAPGLAWQACLKKTSGKLELLTHIDMLLMVEEEIRGGMCQAVYRYAKANNKYMKNYDKSIKSSYIEYLDANNLYGWAMSQKLPVDGFKWVEENDLSKFNEKFIKSYNENSDKGYFLEVDVEYPKNLHKLHSDLLFLPERKKIEKFKKLVYTVQEKEKYKTFKTSTKSRIDIRQSTQSNSIQSKSMGETIH